MTQLILTARCIHALADHEHYLSAEQGITKRIAELIDSCELPKKKNKYGLVECDTDEKGRSKTHLWEAYNADTECDSGYGMRRYSPDEVEQYLAESECRHCISAYRLIQQRKNIRKELGRARRSIRRLGKESVKFLDRVEFE